MTPTEIGRAFVACERWEWRPGMTVRSGENRGWAGVLYEEAPGRLAIVDALSGSCTEHGVPLSPDLDLYPDVTDDATLGAILGLVREAWGDERSVIRHFALSGPAWYLCDGSGQSMLDRQRYFHGPTEAEALLAALRGARGRVA